MRFRIRAANKDASAGTQVGARVTLATPALRQKAEQELPSLSATLAKLGFTRQAAQYTMGEAEPAQGGPVTIDVNTVIPTEPRDQRGGCGRHCVRTALQRPGWRQLERLRGLLGAERRGPDGPHAWTNLLAWYDSQLRIDPYVIGTTIFTAGGEPGWDGSDLHDVIIPLSLYETS
jgi:hypothetical protein